LNGRERLRRFFLIASVICLIAVLAMGVVFAIIGNPFDPFAKHQFSTETWRTGDTKTRAGMARDAIRRHLNQGLNEQQVTSLLGKPGDVISGIDNGGHKLPGVKTYSYHLGCWSGYGLDDAFLYVHFDAGGLVVGAEVSGY
jgi:hypothetical protein